MTGDRCPRMAICVISPPRDNPVALGPKRTFTGFQEYSAWLIGMPGASPGRTGQFNLVKRYRATSKPTVTSAESLSSPTATGTGAAAARIIGANGMARPSSSLIQTTLPSVSPAACA